MLRIGFSSQSVSKSADEDGSSNSPKETTGSSADINLIFLPKALLVGNNNLNSVTGDGTDGPKELINMENGTLFDTSSEDSESSAVFDDDSNVNVFLQRAEKYTAKFRKNLYKTSVNAKVIRAEKMGTHDGKIETQTQQNDSAKENTLIIPS